MSKNNCFGKIFLALLIISFSVIFFPKSFMITYAETNGNWVDYASENFEGGTGVSNDPYQIKTAEQFAYFSKGVSDGTVNASSYVELTDDIDLSGHYWTPVTGSSGFRGIFNGNNHIVRNVTINDETGTNQGLFGRISYGEVRNLGVVDVDIKGGSAVGGLIGNDRGSEISSCYVTGNISGSQHVGLLIGQSGYTDVEKCYTEGKATLISEDSSNRRVGGLIGYASGGSSSSSVNFIKNSYSTAEVEMTGSYDGEYTGGLIGMTNGYCTIDSCYSTGNITGKKYVGGLLGEDFNSGCVMKNCIAFNRFVNGKDRYTNRLAGYKFRITVESSYAFSEMMINGEMITDGTASDIKGENISSYYDMSGISYPESWDFDSIWEIKSGSKRPTLRGIGEDNGSLTSQTPDFSSATIGKGSHFSSTKVMISGNTGSQMLYSVTEAVIPRPFEGDNISDKAEDIIGNYESGDNISVGVGDYLQIYDVDSDGKIIGFYEKQLTEDDIQSDGNWQDNGVPANSFAGGTGTPSDPYLISTASQLAYLAKIVNAGEDTANKYYKLTGNINLSSKEWTPIGVNKTQYFKGNFNGDGNKISNLKIGIKGLSPDDSLSYVGLFGYMKGNQSYIENLGLDVSIYSSKLNAYVGGLAGWTDYNINLSYAEGIVVGGNKNSRDGYVGGLAGYTSGYWSYITNCYANVDVVGGDGTYTYKQYIGGLAGYFDSVKVHNSFATGDVSGGNYSYVGGFGGGISSSSFENNYGTGDVSCGSSGYVGGFAGYSSGTSPKNLYYNTDADQYRNGSAQNPKKGIGYGSTTSIGITEILMKSDIGEDGALVDILNTNIGSVLNRYFWEVRSSENDGYPKFPEINKIIASDRVALVPEDFTYGEGEDKDNIKSNFSLPISGDNGTTITWAEQRDYSNNIVITDNNIAVTRPNESTGDKEVTITATVAKSGGTDQTKDIKITIKAYTAEEAAAAAANEAIATDKEALDSEDFTYSEGEDKDNVKNDFTLPTSGANGTTIAWEEKTDEGNNVVVTDGSVSVKRPSSSEGDQTVTLTATISKEKGTSETKDISLIVKAYTEEEEAVIAANAAIATDKEALDSEDFTYSEGEDKDNVKNDFTLPTSGANGTTIAWEEKTDEGNNVVVTDGSVSVKRPSSSEGDQTVTLTATISKEKGTSETKDISLIVKAYTEEEEAVIAANEAIATDKEVLDSEDFTYSEGEDKDNVKNDFTLPTSGANGTTIAWEEKTDEGNNVVVTDGSVSVKRPSSSEGDQTVTLTATISKEKGTSETKDISLIVKAYTEEEEAVIAANEAIATDKEALDSEDFTYSDGEDKDNVKNDFTLPTSGANGTTIAWEEKTDEGNNVVVTDGSVSVKRPSSSEGDQTVTLTATISKEKGTSETKDISLIVKAYTANEESETEANEAIATDKEALDSEDFTYSEGEDKDNVKNDFTLPTSGANGTTIAWEEKTDEGNNVVITDGSVSVKRPSSSEGDQTVTLTATISKEKGTSETKDISLIVKAYTEEEETVIAANEAIATDKEALDSEDFIYSDGEDKDNVKNDFTLPTSGANGTTIAWEEKTDEGNNVVVIDGNVSVKRPSSSEGDQTVTLTATILKEKGTSETKDISIIIKAYTADEESETEANEAIATDKEALDSEDFTYSEGDGKHSVKNDFTLPTSGANGTTITWEEKVDLENNVVVSGNKVTVTRPSKGSGDTTVILTATISKEKGRSQTKDIRVIIKEKTKEDEKIDTQAPEIKKQPEDKVVELGDNVDLEVEARGVKLDYQWYENTSNNNSNGTEISVATKSLYKVPTESLGTKYYYCVITNTDKNATGNKIAITTSSVAKIEVITKAGENDAKAPKITKQPEDKVVELDDDVDLEVEASGVKLDYQWYENTSNDNIDGTEIKVATKSVYRVPTEKLGIKYYYCVITNTDKDAIGKKIATTTSSIAKVEVIEKKTNAEAPKIIKQPEDIMVKTGYDASLEVKASGVDLSYQWCENTSNNNSDGTEISIATKSIYKVPTDRIGIKYYYCIITNTDVEATGEKTATTTSSVAAVRVSRSSSDNEEKKDNEPEESSNEGFNQKEVADVSVNGKSEDVGIIINSREKNKMVTTVIVDQEKIKEKLDTEGLNSKIILEVKTDSDVVSGQLNGQIVKNMEIKEAVVEIKTEKAIYTLPAKQIKIEEISNQLGKDIELKDIIVNMQISKTSEETVKIVESVAKKGEFTIVSAPLDFEITCTHENKTIEVSKFNSYVEREVVIPEGVNPEKITTGVVVEKNGDIRHVPTKIVNKDGKYYAVINSLTNSTYSVIYHPIEFIDVDDHWSKNAVNDMGSRLIISGVGENKFEPDKEITRGEFASILVKGLGLSEDFEKIKFNDVSEDNALYDDIVAANQYGLIKGYGDETFRPSGKVKREEALVMISRAMEIAKLDIEINENQINEEIIKFKDFNEISDWSKESVAKCIRKEIVLGSNEKLNIKDNITRAETATIIRKLLQCADLIN